MSDDLGTVEPLLGQLFSFGQPYHGPMVDGVLTLPNGGTVSPVEVTAPSTALIAFPGLPVPANSAEEAAFGRILYADAVFFGHDRRYTPRAPEPAFGARAHPLRVADGALYSVTASVGSWSDSPIPPGGTAYATVTVTATGREAGMPSGAIVAVSVSIHNPFASPLYPWPFMVYPAPEGDRLLVSIFGGGVAWPPPPEDGDTYKADDPRFWQSFAGAHEVTLTGGDRKTLPNCAVVALAGSTPAFVAEAANPATQSFVNASTLSTMAETYSVTVPNQYTYSWHNDNGQPDTTVYATLAEAKGAAEAWAAASPTWRLTTQAWPQYGLPNSGAWYEFNPGAWTWRAYNFTVGTEEFSVQFGHTINVDIERAPLVASTLEALLSTASETITPGPLTTSTKLLAVYDASGTAKVLEYERVTSTAGAQAAQLPATFDAAAVIGGASRQRHLAEFHPYEATHAREDIVTTTSRKVVTAAHRLKAGGATLAERIVETATDIVDVWSWEAPNVGVNTFLRLWHLRTTTTTRKINAATVHQTVATFEEKWANGQYLVTQNGSTTTVNDANLGGVTTFSPARASNNVAVLVANTRIFDAVSPSSAADSIPAGGALYTGRPWVAWNPRTAEFGIGAGKSFV